MASTALAVAAHVVDHASSRRGKTVLHPATMASTTSDPALLYFPPNVAHNQSLSSVKFVSACLAGAVAGILGLQNWRGFVLFAVSVLGTTFVMYAVNCRGKPARYLAGGLRELATPGQDNTFTFVLVWTLFYGIVHVYE